MEEEYIMEEKQEKEILVGNLFLHFHVLHDDVVLTYKLDCSGQSNGRVLV